MKIERKSTEEEQKQVKEDDKSEVLESVSIANVVDTTNEESVSIDNVVGTVNEELSRVPSLGSDDDDEKIEQVEVVVTGVETDTTNHYGVVGAGAAMLLGSLPYIVELAVVTTSGSIDTYSIRRPLSQFLSTLASITTSQVNTTTAPSTSTVPPQSGNLPQCPEFPAKHICNDVTLAKWCTDMTQYLADMAQSIATDRTWIAFVTDQERMNEQKRTQMTATGFILQPFPYEKIYVPRGSRHDVVVPVKSNEQFIVWRFDVEDHDIDFTVEFLPLGSPSQRYEHGPQTPAEAVCDTEVELQIIHATTRYIATMNERPVEGTYRCTSPGTVTLVWDNSYSRLRGKNIQYQVQVVHKNIMESATAAADAFDEAARAKVQRQQAIHNARHRQSGEAVILSQEAENSQPPSSSYYLNVTSVHLYRQLFADTISNQSGWLLTAPLNVAGKLASRLFGSPQLPKNDILMEGEDQKAEGTLNECDGVEPELSRQDQEAKSLLEELNGLNMQLLERLETCEDTIAKLAAERDQVRSKLHLALVDKENMIVELGAKDVEVTSLRDELQRFDREREAWGELQQERDALLEEKHRWAMADDFIPDSHDQALVGVDSEVKMNLERELGQAEANVLRLRAVLGYSLSNHLTGTSTRLEKIAREMTASKKQYEDQMKESEQEMALLKQEIIKYRSQKRVLVAEIKNIQTQTAGQVSVATAEANEARMVNRRLKKQNELLLTQIRSLVDDARDQEKILQAQVEEKIRQAQKEVQRLNEDEASSTTSSGTFVDECKVATKDCSEIGEDHEVADSTVTYTLNASDVALLNGQAEPTHQYGQPQRRELVPLPIGNSTTHNTVPSSKDTNEDSYCARLVAFFQKHDPSMLGEVDSMLESYAGVESMLFDSLKLKYSYFAMSEPS